MADLDACSTAQAPLSIVALAWGSSCSYCCRVLLLLWLALSWLFMAVQHVLGCGGSTWDSCAGIAV
jgi:hypothetical protein